MPKKRPTAAETLRERMTALMDVFTGMSVVALTKLTTPYATTTPITPPVAASTADSVMNCSRMCFLRAPRERRMPISRVRSVTLASMMFMMTIPPTTRKTLTRLTATEARVPVRSCQSCMMESEPRMAKLSGVS